MIAQVNYVEWPEFITIVIGVVTLIIAITSIVFSKISATSERVAITEKQNEGDDDNFKVLYAKIDWLEKERVSDKLQYNDSINRLNITLGKIESALDNQNLVIKELKDQLKKHDDR